MIDFIAIEESSIDQPRSLKKANLTPREVDVIYLIKSGQVNKEIAQILGIHKKTVEMHTANIFRKLRVQNRTEAALWATKHMAP